MARIHALLIDDNAENVYIMERLLQQQDVVSTAVTDPTDLENILQTLEKVDIVFLDLEMPKLDGYEVLEILREYIDPNVPVVACSVHTNELGNTRKLGFSSFVAKPLDIDRFPIQVDNILSGSPVWESR
jgi:CheY-like chemotaxis protein